MARIQLPASRLRARKRRRIARATVILTVLFLLVFFGIVGLAYTPSVQIQDVAISGAQTLSSTTLQTFVRERLAGEYWHIFPKSNIFLYPKQQIAADLAKAFPTLASADVHADDFRTIAVNVVEREPRALWCPSADEAQASHCFFMDENGVVYDDAPTFSEPIYASYYGSASLLRQGSEGQAGSSLPKQFLTPAEFQALSALVDAIAQKLSGEEVAGIAVDAQRDVRMRFGSGFMLIFALGDQGGDVFERLALALNAEPLAGRKLADFEYLDLRFGDKLYYKLK